MKSIPTQCLLAAVLFLALATLPGCAIVGVVANDVGGNSMVPAQYIPPKEPTLVLVENFSVASGGDIDGDRLSHYVSDVLKQADIVPLVDYAGITRLREQDPMAYRHMSIAAIGQAVGAKQVIYVSVSEYSPTSSGGTDLVSWKGAVKVKVVDTQTGKSRWPEDLADGVPVSAETSFKETDPEKGDLLVRDELNQTLAKQIAKLFHEWEKDSDDAADYKQ
jgi:hypothetical protein